MKKIFMVFSLILVVGISSFALEGNNIKESMNEKIHQALTILKNKQETNEQKAQKIFKIFDEVFDFPLMARLSLGSREWKSITKEQKDKFTDEFVKLLKKSFIEKLKLYNDQDIKIEDFNITKHSRAKLVTYIVGKKDKINVTYKFYHSKKRGWVIYDVLVSGVSIIQSYRKQFSDLLDGNSFDEFLKKIAQENKSENNA